MTYMEVMSFSSILEPIERNNQITAFTNSCMKFFRGLKLKI